jgi:UPF0271 protein
MFTIDLNCDMGEVIGNDAALMPYISSANIACGFHAGDDDTMKQTIELALKYNVAIGAHPGFNDKENFGRNELQLTEEEYYDLVRTQLNILQKHIDTTGAIMHHVKPHGALYNMSAKNYALASVIARAVKDHNSSLILYGLSNSFSIAAATDINLLTASEVFADRTYTDGDTLTPRTQQNALITNDEKSLQQVLQMIQQQTVTSTNNKIIPVKTDTICIHGDGKYAVEFAKKISMALQENGIKIAAVKS